MFDLDELNDRHYVITQSPLADVKILDENYSNLLSNAYNTNEQEQLMTLRVIVKNRIQLLEINSQQC